MGCVGKYVRYSDKHVLYMYEIYASSPNEYAIKADLKL